MQRYLNDEPVQVCPPSAGYRLRKFARRNKTVMFAALAVFMALSAGMASTMVALPEAQNQRDVAEYDRIEAEKARVEERKQREIAEKNEFLTRENEERVKAFFLEKVLHPWRRESLGGLGKDVTVREAIGAAEKEITTWFENRPIVEVGIRMLLAQKYHDFGEAEVATAQLRRVAEITNDEFIPDEYYSFIAVEQVSIIQRKTGNFDQALALLQDILAKLMETWVRARCTL